MNKNCLFSNGKHAAMAISILNRCIFFILFDNSFFADGVMLNYYCRSLNIDLIHIFFVFDNVSFVF